MELAVMNTWSWLGLAVDAVIVIWLLFSLIRGAKDGFVASLIGLATLAIAIAGAWILSGLLADPITKLIRGSEAADLVNNLSYNTTKQVVRVVIGIVMALVITVLVKVLGKSIGRIFNGIPIVGGINQLMGAILSVAVTAALILAILYAWESFFRESYEKMLTGAPVARFADAHNVIAKLFGRLK